MTDDEKAKACADAFKPFASVRCRIIELLGDLEDGRRDIPEIALAFDSLVRAAVAEEREACAMIAMMHEPRVPDPKTLDPDNFYILPERLAEKLAEYKADASNEIAAAIRARNTDSKQEGR